MIGFQTSRTLGGPTDTYVPTMDIIRYASSLTQRNSQEARRLLACHACRLSADGDHPIDADYHWLVGNATIPHTSTGPLSQSACNQTSVPYTLQHESSSTALTYSSDVPFESLPSSHRPFRHLTRPAAPASRHTAVPCIDQQSALKSERHADLPCTRGA